jgi:hypothetical protein
MSSNTIVEPTIVLKPRDYSTGKIYKIFVEGKPEECYIGSTTWVLKKRLNQHKQQASNVKQKKSASCILFKNDATVVIELVEDFPCKSKLDLETRERYWLEKHPRAINKNIPTQTCEERVDKNREHIQEMNAKWREANKEHIAEYVASRREIDNAQAKARYDAGYKAQRNEAKKVKVACDICKKIMNKNSIPLHKKSVHKTD